MAASKPSTLTCEQVERMWLDAGRRGDTKTMQSLFQTHPEWLALDREVGFKSSFKYVDSEDATSFCDWDKFYLPTIGASALHAAAWDGNIKILEFLLYEGQPVDTRGRRGITALMATLMRHNVQALRAVFHGAAVVQLNTVVDCQEEDAARLIHTLSVVKLLLRHGAKTEARDHDGKTALHLAMNDELFKVAKLLLENGARMDAQDSSGRSPLHACLHTCPEQSGLVTNLLISHGAPFDLPNQVGETPLTIVVQRGDTTALQQLMNHPSLASTLARQNFSGAVLLQAAELGVVDIVRFLLDGKYTSIDFVNAYGETALHLAIVKQRKQLVDVLCTSETAELLLDARTKGMNESVVHYAARYGSASDLQSILLLLKKRTVGQIDVANARGLTPLYLATAVATVGSPVDRRAKVAQLEKHGASLFSKDMPLFQNKLNGANVELIIVHPAVRRCLAIWLVEASHAAISDFCMNWLACVQCPPSGKRPGEKQTWQVSLNPVVAAIVCAGYAVDALPLLLVLPFKRESMTQFFRFLETLTFNLEPTLLQKLQSELVVAWQN